MGKEERMWEGKTGVKRKERKEGRKEGRDKERKEEREKDELQEGTTQAWGPQLAILLPSMIVSCPFSRTCEIWGKLHLHNLLQMSFIYK